MGSDKSWLIIASCCRPRPLPGWKPWKSMSNHPIENEYPWLLGEKFLTGLQLAMESRRLCPWGEVKQRYLDRWLLLYSHGSELVFYRSLVAILRRQSFGVRAPVSSFMESKALFRPVAEWNSPWVSRCWWVENDPGDRGESNEDCWILIGEQKVSYLSGIYFIGSSSALFSWLKVQQATDSLWGAFQESPADIWSREASSRGLASCSHFPSLRKFTLRVFEVEARSTTRWLTHFLFEVEPCTSVHIFLSYKS